jgi:hypothetical protein
MAPTTTWTRVARRLGFDHNPLRRRLDLIDGWLVPAVITAFLTLGPLLAGGVGLWVHAGNAAAQRAERSWHEVQAVVLAPVPGPALSNGSNRWLVWAPARWTTGGRTHTGNVPVPAGTSQDAVVPVWLSRAGHVQVPPLSAGAARDRIVVAAVLALASLAVLLTILAALARWLIDRRRLAGWEAAWRSVGPQWSDWRNRSGS